MNHILEIGARRLRMIPNILRGNSWVRFVTIRAPTRAAVHGIKAPLPDLVDKKQVEMEIGSLKEARERRRKMVEEIVDSQLRSSQMLSDSQILKLS